MYRILLKPLSVTSSMFRTPISNNHENIQFVEQNNTTVLRCLVECNLHHPKQLMYTDMLDGHKNEGKITYLKVPCLCKI